MSAVSTVISQNKVLNRRLSSQHLASTMEGSGDVATDDLRDILALTAERTIASTNSRRRQLELDEATMTRPQEAIEAAISGRNAMGREAILRTLEGAASAPMRSAGTKSSGCWPSAESSAGAPERHPAGTGIHAVMD